MEAITECIALRNRVAGAWDGDEEQVSCIRASLVGMRREEEKKQVLGVSSVQ